MASITSSEWRVLCEKYQRSVTLSEIESKKDPENDPFRSKYNARELLKQIKSSLGQYAGENENEQGENGQQQAEKELQVEQQIAAGGDSPAGLSAARLGVIEYQLGLNHTETEELSAGEEHLMNCIRLMDKYEVTQENISLFIQSRNQIGVLWAGRGEIETAQGFLESAEALYNRYMKESCYMEGRHCLAAASVVVGLAGEVPSVAAAKESEAESEKREKLCQRKAEIARCWIKYCLNLINDAKKMLEDNIGELDADRQAEMKVRRRQEEEEKEKGRKTVVLFGSSDTSDSILSMEEKVSCAYPLDFNEARAIFLVGQNYVNEAKEYFQIDGHATDHIEVVQDHSALFKALAFFEDDYESMNKKPVEDKTALTFEESGDDSGEFQEDMPIELGSGSQWNEDLLIAGSTAEPEEGSADYTEDFLATPEGGDVDYSQFVFRDRVPIKQNHPQNLKLHEEGFIL
ncbi:KIF1-binding protein-like [Acipenser ruthenus]|uniref:KIF-binding protein n=1 Tax=Acipenser ruthenus TaxID=7906 RepID=A0A662Z0X8_ACIRT|nr:KIF1-binding protein-like [Acipenser ruthenus]